MQVSLWILKSYQHNAEAWNIIVIILHYYFRVCVSQALCSRRLLFTVHKYNESVNVYELPATLAGMPTERRAQTRKMLSPVHDAKPAFAT